MSKDQFFAIFYALIAIAVSGFAKWVYVDGYRREGGSPRWLRRGIVSLFIASFGLSVYYAQLVYWA